MKATVNQLGRAIMIAFLLLIPAGAVFAQEAAEESSIGFGPMVAILGAGLMAIMAIGLAINSRDSSDESENE